MQFKIRSLFALTVLAAVLTMPSYRYALKLHERWNAGDDVSQSSQGLTVKLPVVTVATVTTVVSVPDGGTRLISGIKPRYLKQADAPHHQTNTVTNEQGIR